MTATRPTAATRALTLADGTVLAMRPMGDDDGERLVRFHHRLSDRTTYYRFFSVHPELFAGEVDRFAHVDHRDREAVVAVDREGEIAAVARFDRLHGSDDAEAAFVVADELQGRGVGSALFRVLAERAREVGVRRFVAETLPHNHRMLAVFRHAGLPVQSSFADGIVHVIVEL